MKYNLYPCLALKGKIAEAAAFYLSIFENSQVKHSSPLVAMIELLGQPFMLLNEGPSGNPNASISFMVTSESPEDTERYWHKLIPGGKIMMDLGSYPWSTRYGWVEDQYGVSWQLYTGSLSDTPQKICPTLMFTGDMAGKASEAIQFYTGIFPGSGVQGILNYGEGEGDRTDFVKHAQFKLNGYIMMAMDSSMDHAFRFNDGISLVASCDTQDEIDSYWEALCSDGGKEVACGWLTDKYGVSWQIIPGDIMSMILDPERGNRVMSTMMNMVKLDIEKLRNA